VAAQLAASRERLSSVRSESVSELGSAERSASLICLTQSTRLYHRYHVIQIYSCVSCTLEAARKIRQCQCPYMPNSAPCLDKL
jgi:hypothetical protein